MRKIVTISAVAAAALLLAACGQSESVDANNATVVEMNAVDATAGTTNDAMTNVDAAAGANVAADANAVDANAAAATNAVDANAAAANVAK